MTAACHRFGGATPSAPYKSFTDRRILADTPPRRNRRATYRRCAASALSNCRWGREGERPGSRHRVDRWSCRTRRLFCPAPRPRASQSGPASALRHGRGGLSSHRRPCRLLLHHATQETPALSGSCFNRGDGTSILRWRTCFILSDRRKAVSAWGRVGRCSIRCRRAAVWCADATA